MRVTVKGKNKFEVSDSIRDYASEKLEKFNVFFKDYEEVDANVLCKDYETFKKAEITIPTKNIILRAESEAGTIYSAIDLAIDKLESQIRKHKSKIYKSLKKREGISQYYSSNSDFDIDKLKTEIMVTNLVKTKSVKLQPMSVDDAIMQMEMLGHSFFVFTNIETDAVCVVYLREDLDYGIIETR